MNSLPSVLHKIDVYNIKTSVEDISYLPKLIATTSTSCDHMWLFHMEVHVQRNVHVVYKNIKHMPYYTTQQKSLQKREMFEAEFCPYNISFQTHLQQSYCSHLQIILWLLAQNGTV